MKNLTIVLCILFFGCTQSSKSLVQDSAGNCIDPVFDVSITSKQFVFDWCSEFSSKGDKELIPSQILKEKYSLKKIDKEWHFSGFLETKDSVVVVDLRSLSIKMRQTKQNRYIAHIPFSKTQEFFRLLGISYFEISTKVKQK